MICEAVERMHVEVLVVGSRGLGQIKRQFLISPLFYSDLILMCLKTRSVNMLAYLLYAGHSWEVLAITVLTMPNVLL